MSSAPSITEKLSNVQHMPSLIAATVASDKPTDLYLIRDIIKMSYESIQTRVFLQKYLTNLLLTSRNVLVKIKVLKLVVSLLEEGHPDFHRNLQKTPECFKESARIKTTDITMAADCGRIRDLANKILDRLYEEPPAERQCPYGIPTTQRGTSSGSSGSNTGSGGGGVSIGKGGGALGGRIQGFGTSPHPSQQQSLLTEQFTNAVGSILGSAPGVSSGSGSRSGNKKSYDEKYATLEYIPTSSSVGRMGGTSSQTPPSNKDTGLPYSSNAGSEHVRGRPGGGWDDRQEEKEKPVAIETPSTPISNTVGSVDSEQERRLVEDITTPGGIRVAPLKEDLKKFITRCKTLDCLSVVEFLRLKLQSENSQVVSKALFVLESLVRSDIPDIISYLDLTLDELTTLSTTSQHASIKAKSTKILHQLNAVESMNSKDGLSRQHSSNSDTGNLLDVGGANEDKEQSSSEMNSIFSGLTLTDSNNPPTQSKQQLTRNKQTPKPVTNNAHSSSLLEGLTLADTPNASSSLSNQSQSLKDDLVDFSTDNEAAVLDPLLSTSSTNAGSGDDPLGGLLSLEETSTGAQITTPLSSDPLMPTQTPLVSNSIPLGGATSQPPPTLATIGPYMTTTQPSVILGPVISGPSQGGLQQQIPTQQQYQYSSQQMYQSSMNRPVQLMPQSQTTAAGTESSGFDFLSKGKPGAFDFIQDEIKAARGKN